MTTRIEVSHHAQLTDGQISSIRALFDAQYNREFGPWTLDQPYGYSPAEFHITAWENDALLGHVGIQPRQIAVADWEVRVAGTGGVLIAPESRGTGLGKRLLERAAETMCEETAAEFGYLGCREEVVAFYQACGWLRIQANERSISRKDGTSVVFSTGPLMILAGTLPIEDWPVGPIDLRGTPW